MITINGRVFENTYSSAQWATANPVLLNRVLGFDTTVKSFKMGDGITHWLDLPFYCLVIYEAGTGILIAGNTFSLDEDYTDSLYPKLGSSYADPSWITSLDYSKLTGAPADLSDFANDVNFINQAGARAAVSAAGSLSYNPSTGVFNYVQPTNVSTFTNDAGYLITSAGDARYPQLSAAYVNPAFIASIPWSKITGVPTTIAGYGITDFNTLGDARYIRQTGGTLSGNLLASSDNTLNMGSSAANLASLFTRNISSNAALQFITSGGSSQIWLIGAVEAMRIRTTTLNLLIGGATENNYKVDIQATGTAGYLKAGNLSVDPSGVPTFAIGKIAVTEGTNGRVGQATLVAGVATITISGLTTSSRAFTQLVSIGGTVTTTWHYKAVCTANTLIITAITNTGTTDATDTSVLSYMVIN